MEVSRKQGEAKAVEDFPSDRRGDTASLRQQGGGEVPGGWEMEGISI